jgi:GxxExxY protein
MFNFPSRTTVCFATGFRLDFLVEGEVIVELKAVERLHPVDHAQLYSYLRLRGSRVFAC